jgi:hypothetical protein
MQSLDLIYLFCGGFKTHSTLHSRILKVNGLHSVESAKIFPYEVLAFLLYS